MSAVPPTALQRRFGAGGPTLAQVGEHVLLEQLVAIAQPEPGEVRGSMDDAAVWSPPEGCDIAVSVDALVEEVDFRRDWISPRQLGRRAFAVAVSDLAATGASPLNCLVTLCARPSEQLEDVLEVQRGLCAAAAAAGCAVVGGDVSATDGPMVIDVSVTGSLPRGRALRRDAGRPGNLLVVTGTLGRSAAGLRLLRDGSGDASPIEREWVQTQIQPVTRLREGAHLLAAGIVCAGDLSDGILVDAARTACASSCAAEIWVASLPVDGELRERFSRDWLELAAGGGEDFELLAAVAEQDVAALQQDWPADLAPLTVVGRLGDGSGLRLLDHRGGTDHEWPRTLASHFS